MIKVVPVSSVATQIRGVSYSKGDAVESPRPGYVMLLRANNITEFGISTDEVVYVPEVRVSPKQRLLPGDILIAASSGSLEVVGKAARVNEPIDATFGAFCKVVRPSADVVPDYLASFFQTERYRRTVSNLAAGANINNLRNEHIDNLDLPLPWNIDRPDLNEQERIAAILDKADDIRRRRREAMGLNDEFLRSLFLEMFGDPVTNPKEFPVGTIRDLVDSTTYGTSEKAHPDTDAYPVLRMNNITYEGGWDFSSLKYVDLPVSSLDRYLVHKGQLLFNRTNSKELVGKTAVYRKDEPMAYAGYLVRAIAKPDADAEYIAAYLNSNHGKAVLRGMCKSIVGMANINAQEFLSIPIQLPPPHLQHSFGDIVRSLESKRESQHEATQCSEMLFQSLQQRAFSGEL